MKKMFWENPYLDSLATCVIEVKQNKILCAETIGFAFAGGQESDTVWINDMLVINSERHGDLIYYHLHEDHGLTVGASVVMKIDWQRRYSLMRLHFAAELILELVTRKLGSEKIGAHIAQTKARIDFRHDKNISFAFDELLQDYNRIIASDAPIKTGFTDVAKQQRYWEIAGFSKVPCGGTHVKSTAEVGYVSLKRVNLGNGKERIEIKLLDLPS